MSQMATFQRALSGQASGRKVLTSVNAFRLVVCGAHSVLKVAARDRSGRFRPIRLLVTALKARAGRFIP